MSQSQRNDPCPCGSGKKYKKCCMNATRRSRLAARVPAKNKNVFIALAVIFFLGVFLRYYGFQQPHGLTFDEGLYAQLLGPQLAEDPTNYSTQAAYQRLMAQEGIRRIPKYLDRPLFKHPPLYCYLIAASYKFFGRSDLSAVSVSILLGSLMILAVFFLASALYDDRVGLLSAFFLCIDPVHWVCSERVWMETTLSFFILLSILFFVLGQKQKYFLLFSGISIGLAMLTKYPGALALFIISSFVLFFDRSWLKERWFWGLCGVSLLMFSPWIFWNWRTYESFSDAFVSVHYLAFHWNSTVQVLSTHRAFLMVFIFLGGLFLLMRRKIGAFLGGGTTDYLASKQKKVYVAACFLAIILAVYMAPFLRAIVKEAFIWKNVVQVGWSNPFHFGPWHFYLTRLAELSPLYIFAIPSFFLFFRKNKGDRLLIWSSLWILGAFILLGNYQSRYILPAVPFLVILSARWQVLAYDKLTSSQSAARSSRFFLKIIFVGISLYFVLKTLRTDWLIAIGPDFGYF